MSKKVVVWIHGSNGMGKTTQNRMLIRALAGDHEGVFIQGEENGVNYYYTKFGTHCIAIGKMGLNQCSGIDSVFSKLKVDGVTKSIEKALDDEECPIIIVECVFATMKWYKSWVDSGVRKRFKLLVAFLDANLWNNYNRIAQRRAVKQNRKDWWNILLEDTVYKHTGAKNSEIRTIFDKLSGSHKTSNGKLADCLLKIDATLPKNKVHETIINFIVENI